MTQGNTGVTMEAKDQGVPTKTRDKASPSDDSTPAALTEAEIEADLVRSGVQSRRYRRRETGELCFKYGCE